MKLLVVDEDPNFARILGTVLGGEGHSLEVVDRPSALAAAVARVRPDALLYAADAGDPSSIAVLAGLRSVPGAAGIPCLVITGVRDERVERACAQAGVAHVLVRPFSLLDLAGLVRGMELGRAPAVPAAPAPGGTLDLDHTAQLVRLWARRANGILQLQRPEGTRWASLADGGLLDEESAAVIRSALYGGELEFQPCPVDGQGNRTAMAAILWGEVRAAERQRAPTPRSATLSPGRLAAHAVELPLPPAAARLMRALAAPTGFGRLADELQLDLEEAQACIAPLVALGVLSVQDTPPLPTPPRGPVGHASIVNERPVASRSGVSGAHSDARRPDGTTSTASALSSATTGATSRGTEGRPRLPVAPAPTPGLPRPAPPPDAAALARRLRREVDLLRSSDAWVVLGVPHDAAQGVVQAAGERMRARYQGLADTHTGEVRELALAMLQRVNEAIGSIDAPADVAAVQPGDEYFHAGLRAMARGEWALADRRFSAARDQNLDSARNLAHLGWARAHNPEIPSAERHKDGLELLLLAEQFAADYADGQYFLAMVLHRGGDDDGALRRLRRALRAEPGHVAANALARKLRRGPAPPTR